jgi:hypothetical protein
MNYINWREEMIYESNITGQKIALENLLNRRIENAGGQISIVEKNDGGIYLSTALENLDNVFLSTETEDSDSSFIPKLGEEASELDVDFIVYIPAGVNPDHVNQIVDRYAIAGYEYEVKTEI